MNEALISEVRQLITPPSAVTLAQTRHRAISVQRRRARAKVARRSRARSRRS
jgi:hypothetical protein